MVMASRAHKSLVAVALTIFFFAVRLPLCAQQTTESPLPAPAPAPAREAARKLSLDGVPNFAEVTPALYRGAQPSKQGFDALAKMGVGVVIDLRAGSRDGERDQVTKLGLQYISIPWYCGHPDDSTVALFLSALRQNSGKKIFVHCKLGSDRTGMMIAAYRIAEQGWDAEEARKEMQAFGFSSIHEWMCPGLADYESRFPTVFNTSRAFENLRPVPAQTNP
jgi:tyrosine-protein phosphatase SIW14